MLTRCVTWIEGQLAACVGSGGRRAPAGGAVSLDDAAWGLGSAGPSYAAGGALASAAAQGPARGSWPLARRWPIILSMSFGCTMTAMIRI